MEIEIRPEIGILVFNCAAVKKWKQSVAWFPSYGVQRITDAEHEKNAMFLRCYSRL